MELWVDMINSTNFEKVFYFSLAVLFSFLSSWYYQSLIRLCTQPVTIRKDRRNKDLIIKQHWIAASE